jgi:hypothetical protein
VKKELKLSIITINYNNKAGLEKTIQSVVEQTFTNFEYIVHTKMNRFHFEEKLDVI